MKEFLKNKSIGGFYVPAVSVILSVVAVIVYAVGFNGTIYYSTMVVALPLVASVLFVVLSMVKQTANLASMVAGILQFVSLLMFISVSYMYLTEAFFGGISLEAIANMNTAWPVTLILLIVNVIVCNIGFYKKQERGA